MQINNNVNRHNSPAFKALLPDELRLEKLGPNFIKAWEFSKPKFQKEADKYDIFVGTDRQKKGGVRLLVLVRNKIDEVIRYGHSASNFSEDSAGLMAALKTAISSAICGGKNPSNQELVKYDTGLGKKTIEEIFDQFDKRVIK